MKRLLMTSTILLLLIGCENNATEDNIDQTQDQSQEHTEQPVDDNHDENLEPESPELPALDKMVVLELANQVGKMMMPTIDDTKRVTEYVSKSDYLGALTRLMDQKLAEDFVSTYFIEEEGVLYQDKLVVPILIDGNQPFELRLKADDHFVVEQDATIDHPRSTELHFRYYEDTETWKISLLKKEPVAQMITSEDIKDPLSNLVLVNKQSALPLGYEPEDLVIPDVAFSFAEDLPKKQMREEAAFQLEKLFAKAEEENIELYAQSGYRSYDRQEVIFAYNANRLGEEEANKYSARPGESEHQTGLAMDVTSRSINFQLIEEFGETVEGRWIAEHAAEFGFIIRYPKGKELITGYQFEPWHLRYVGQEVALYIDKRQITFEEFIEENETVILGE